MKEKYAVEFNNVSKIYNLKVKGKDKELKQSKKFYALKDISFSIEKGEIVGILGTNGSGKSTLSSIIAGITSVDSGEVIINGEQALIAINSGLNNQLTGLENIKAKGALLGLPKSKVDNIIQGVIDFAELGDFIYQPVKRYSSGMKSRLGFAISINLDPEIIIIDEALSVGDSGFAAKCIKKMEEFRDSGKTIFFVSHSLAQVKNFCNKALWIEGGELKAYGDIGEVAKEYSDYVEELKKKSNEEKKAFSEAIFQKRLVNESRNNDLKYKIESMKINKNNFLNTLYCRVKSMFKKHKTIMITSIIFISFLSITGVAMIGRGNSDKLVESEENKPNELLINKEESAKSFDYLFLIEGEGISEYRNQYRTYLDNVDGKTVFAIINIEGDSDGKINITNVPISLQFYYENLMLTDEIRFCNVLDSEINFNNIKKNVLGKEVDEIFIVSPEKLIEFTRNLGMNLEIANNDFIWTIDDKTYSVNHGVISEDNTNAFKNVSSEILQRVIGLTSEDKNKYLLDLLQNNSDKMQGILSTIENYPKDNLNITFKDIQTESLVLENLITSDEVALISESNLLKRNIIVLTRDHVTENIYYKALIAQVNKAKVEVYEDLSGDSNPVSNSNIGGSSGTTEQLSRPQRPITTPERPSASEVPSNPEVPSEPEVPGDSVLPNEPEIPTVPEVPSEPEVPEVPESSGN